MPNVGSVPILNNRIVFQNSALEQNFGVENGSIQEEWSWLKTFKPEQTKIHDLHEGPRIITSGSECRVNVMRTPQGDTLIHQSCVQPGGRWNESNFVIQPNGQLQKGSPQEVEQALRTLFENHMVKPQQKKQTPFVDLAQPHAPKENGDYTDEVAALKARHSTGGFPTDSVDTPESLNDSFNDLFQSVLGSNKSTVHYSYSFQHDINTNETEYIVQDIKGSEGTIRYIFNAQNKLKSVIQETFSDEKRKVVPLPEPSDQEMEQKLRQFIQWGNEVGYRTTHE